MMLEAAASFDSSLRQLYGWGSGFYQGLGGDSQGRPHRGSHL